MLNLRTDVPIKQEVLDEVQVRFAQMRDLENEVVDLLRIAVKADNEIFLTREEVAEKFRCAPNKVPRCIPRFRVGKNWLFKRSDVEAFINKRLK